MYAYFFFFFKQKTAYEMRISDWSSDVCSSDLNPEAASVIFSTGEIGHVEDPSATAAQKAGLQQVVYDGGKARIDRSLDKQLQEELAERVEADQSTAFVAFTFLSCAVVWLVLASSAGLISRSEEHTSELPSLMRTSY